MIFKSKYSDPFDFRATVLGFLLLWLMACSSAPPASTGTGNWVQRQANLNALPAWQVQGRVNARYYEEAHTPRIRWQQEHNNYTIRLWGTLNAGATLIEGKPGEVRFEQSGRVLTAATPEDLILQELGYELPVSQLNYWIRGLPNPGQTRQLELDALDHLLHLEQAGWTLEFADYRSYGDYAMPRRVEMQRDDKPIRLTFVGLNWTFEEAAP